MKEQSDIGVEVLLFLLYFFNPVVRAQANAMADFPVSHFRRSCS